MTPCIIPECNRLRRSRTADLCNTHYERRRRNGTTDDLRPSYETRLWSRIEFGDCWTWLGGLNAQGYGQIMRDGKNVRTHRAVYELLVGPIPADLELDHLCRVRSCCNPDHLEPVSHKENVHRGTAGRFFRAGTCSKGHSLKDAYSFPSNADRLICRTCTNIRNAAREKKGSTACLKTRIRCWTIQ